MTSNLILCVLLTLTVASGCGVQKGRTPASNSNVQSASPAQASSPEFVGLVPAIQIVANPSRFDGKRLQVLGFLHLEFEGDGIYMTREDYAYRITMNALWVSVPRSDPLHCKDINNSYAVVDGVFNASNRGHFGMFSGGIENVTRCKRWAKVKS